MGGVRLFVLVHLFPYLSSNINSSGRILMETAVPPVVIPMWLTGACSFLLPP